MNTSKLKEHKILKEIKVIFDQNKVTGMSLVGGAVIDILQGRVPKDYDFMCHYGENDAIKALKTNGFSFMYDTATSRTYAKGSVIIQLLKTERRKFDFTISKVSYNLEREILTIDQEAWENKVLIPNSYTNKEQVLNSLARIPHWIRKGFRIKNQTYFSLLNCLNTKAIVISQGADNS